jgi:hypothetical protein
MTGTTRRLGRTVALVAVAATAALALAGTALADGGGDGGDDGLVKGTPCTYSARACVDLKTNTAWLIHDGDVTRGPVGISHGGQGKETPTGTFKVQWKDQNHKSAEYNNAPMPFSVFFAQGGIAFHEGNPKSLSAGCVHLAHDDAVAWFDDLQVGDEVQIN